MEVNNQLSELLAIISICYDTMDRLITGRPDGAPAQVDWMEYSRLKLSAELAENVLKKYPIETR